MSARAHSPSGAIVRCVVAVLVVSAALLGVVAVVAGADAARSATVGAGIGLAVMAFGTTSMNAVVGVMPALSMPLALMTYTLQIVVTVALLVGLTRSGAFDADLDRRWAGLALIAVVIVWMVAHVTTVSTARLPVYDLDRRRAGGGAE